MAFFKVVTLGIAAVNAVRSYRKKRRAEEDAERQRRDNYSAPDIPVVDESSPVPVVFGTVKIKGPNVVLAFSGDDYKKPDDKGRQNGIEGGSQRLWMHLVFCQGPIDHLVEVRSSGRRLAAIPLTDLGNYRSSSADGADGTTLPVESWNLEQHHALTGDSRFTLDDYYDRPASADPDDTYDGFTPWATRTAADGIEGVAAMRNEITSMTRARIYGGWPDQTIDTELEQIFQNATGEDLDLPGYQRSFGIAGQVMFPYGGRLDEIEVVVKRTFTGSSGEPIGAPGAFAPGDPDTPEDMNVYSIIYEVMTDGIWGADIDRQFLSDPHFNYAAENTDAPELSFLWTQRQSYGELIAELLRHADATLYNEPTTGEFVVRAITDDYDLDTMTQQDGPSTKPIQTLTPDNIIGVDEQQTGTKELINEVVLKFTDRLDQRERTVVENSVALQEAQSARSQEVQYPFVVDPDLAARLASREIDQLGQPLRSFEIRLPVEAAEELRPGDVAVLVWPDYGIQEMLIRITGFVRARLDDRSVTVDARQDVFAASRSTTAPPSEIEAPPLEEPPVDADDLVIEAPFYLELEQLRQIVGFSVNPATDAIPDTTDSVPLISAIQTQQSAIDFSVHSLEDGVTDAEVGPAGRQFSPTLDLSVDWGDAGLNTRQNTPEDFSFPDEFSPRIEDDFGVFYHDGIISTIDIDTGLVRFGWLDTTIPYPLPPIVDGTYRILGYGRYTSGGQLRIRPTYGVEDPELAYPTGTEVSAASLVRTAIGQQSPSAMYDDPITTDARRVRPYAPGALNATVVGNDVEFTWAQRERRGMQVDQLNTDNITPLRDILWQYEIIALNPDGSIIGTLVDDQVSTSTLSATLTEDDELDEMLDLTGDRRLADGLLLSIVGYDPELDLESRSPNHYVFDRSLD